MVMVAILVVIVIVAVIVVMSLSLSPPLLTAGGVADGGGKTSEVKIYTPIFILSYIPHFHCNHYFVHLINARDNHCLIT